MMPTLRLARLITLLTLILGLLGGVARAGDERAPFTAVRFVENGVEIEVDGTWYRLRSLDGIRADTILAHSKKAFPEKWRKRFIEDLEEVLAGLDHRCGPTVALEVEKLDGGGVLKLPRVAMTAEKRRDARNARRGKRLPTGPPGKDEEDYAKLAPFTAVRFPESGAEVQVQSTWYRLVAIDGVPATDILAFSKRTYGRRWAKRIGEDLVQVLSQMGHPPGKDVALSLEDLESGQAVEKPRVAMTKENRRQVWIGSAAGSERGPTRRVKRRHAGKVTAAYAHLAEHVEGNAFGRDQTLTRELAEQDLDELEWHVVHRFSYRDLRGVDVAGAFDTVRAGLPAKLSRPAFAIRVVKLLALFGDAHSRLTENPARIYASGYLPFLVADTSERLVALQPDRSEFLDPEHPYVTHLDGRPIEVWVEAAARMTHRGTPQLRRRGAIRNLRFLQHLRRELGQKETPQLTVQVEDEKGTVTRELTLDIASRPPVYGAWPRGASRRLGRDLGYLRIPSMVSEDRADLDRLVDARMSTFEGTKGLVIDVRGNGGGTRDLLRRLFPYFLTAEDGARVVNVAKYRLREGDDRNDPRGFLSDRSLHPAVFPGWTDAQRAAIVAADKAFDAEWMPGDAEFSAWHYMVVEHGSNPAAYTYEAPVVVLIDSGCFSATDIFVGAFAGWRNVTLMGLATGGGSGRSRGLRLTHSRLGLRLSSMASFRPDGKIYELGANRPDVVVRPRAEDFVVGGTDTLLEAAVRHLRRASQK